MLEKESNYKLKDGDNINLVEFKFNKDILKKDIVIKIGDNQYKDKVNIQLMDAKAFIKVDKNNRAEIYMIVISFDNIELFYEDGSPFDKNNVAPGKIKAILKWNKSLLKGDTIKELYIGSTNNIISYEDAIKKEEEIILPITITIVEVETKITIPFIIEVMKSGEEHTVNDHVELIIKA